MTTNVGSLDRALRILIALGLFSLYFVLEGSLRWWALGGIIPLGTALLGNCPLYQLLGISTCARKA